MTVKKERGKSRRFKGFDSFISGADFRRFLAIHLVKKGLVLASEGSKVQRGQGPISLLVLFPLLFFSGEREYIYIYIYI